MNRRVNSIFPIIIGILTLFLSIGKSNASTLFATATNSSVSDFTLDWTDSNNDLIIQNTEVSLPISQPQFSGVGFTDPNIDVNSFDILKLIPNIPGVTSGFDQSDYWGFGNSQFSAVVPVNTWNYKAIDIHNVTGFDGTFTPITALINGTPQSTGVISVSLDTSLKSTIEVENVNGIYSITQNLHLLINSPLLTSLGLKNLPINIVETGPSSDGMNYDLVGGGVVGGSSPFAGTSFFDRRNRYEHHPLIDLPNLTFGWIWTFGSTATVRLPDVFGNTPQDTTGQGIMEAVVPVPEPTSTLSLLALGTLGAASTLKRKIKPSQSSEKETTEIG